MAGRKKKQPIDDASKPKAEKSTAPKAENLFSATENPTAAAMPQAQPASPTPPPVRKERKEARRIVLGIGLGDPQATHIFSETCRAVGGVPPMLLQGTLDDLHSFTGNFEENDILLVCNSSEIAFTNNLDVLFSNFDVNDRNSTKPYIYTASEFDSPSWRLYAKVRSLGKAKENLCSTPCPGAFIMRGSTLKTVLLLDRTDAAAAVATATRRTDTFNVDYDENRYMLIFREGRGDIPPRISYRDSPSLPAGLRALVYKNLDTDGDLYEPALVMRPGGGDWSYMLSCIGHDFFQKSTSAAPVVLDTLARNSVRLAEWAYNSAASWAPAALTGVGR